MLASGIPGLPNDFGARALSKVKHAFDNICMPLVTLVLVPVSRPSRSVLWFLKKRAKLDRIRRQDDSVVQEKISNIE